MGENARISPDDDAELAAIQGAVAGVKSASEIELAATANGKVTSARTVEFMGEKFRIAEKTGLMPLLKFSAYADMDVQDPKALGAMYAMLKDSIHPGSPGCGECEDCREGSEQACESYDAGDWHAFEEHACRTKADADDLFDVITAVMGLISGRPTRPPEASSPGPRRTSVRSTGRSSGRGGRGSRR